MEQPSLFPMYAVSQTTDFVSARRPMLAHTKLKSLQTSEIIQPYLHGTAAIQIAKTV
jgi:hypothetical protein